MKLKSEIKNSPLMDKNLNDIETKSDDFMKAYNGFPINNTSKKN